MESLKPVKLNLAERFKKGRRFRQEFFQERAKAEIAIQIKKLRDLRNLRQVDFSKLAGMKQSAVSRIEQADYSGWTFKTLLKVAETLDARLRITFEPMEDVIREYEQRERTAAETDGSLEKLRGEVDQFNIRPPQIGETVPFDDVVREFLENHSTSGFKEIGEQEPNRPASGPFHLIEPQSGHPNF